MLSGSDLAVLLADRSRALTRRHLTLAEVQRDGEEESRVGLTLGPLQIASPTDAPERMAMWRSLYGPDGSAISLHDAPTEVPPGTGGQGGGFPAAEIAAERDGFWHRAAANKA